MGLSRYYHTVRYLRPVQVYARARGTVRHPRADLAPAPPVRQVVGTWTPPVRRPPSMGGPTSFAFLNCQGDLSELQGWDDPARSRLWRYNLHYFDDLNAREADRRAEWHRALMERWIRENPPASGTGWEPYPLSLRVVNWVKWALAGNALSQAAHHSLAVQARVLTQSLEYHLLGNHLLANAKALVFVGCYFDGPEAERWVSMGARLLRDQLREQVLTDGGHFELSPMYHAIVLEDLLDVLNLQRAYGVQSGTTSRPGVAEALVESTARVGDMRRWLKAMCHPDGEIAFFNDAACGIAPAPQELEAYAARLGLPEVPGPAEGITHLADTGYVRLQRSDAVAILDVGEVCPRYLPAHAHADTLSFELSLGGARVVVNCGTSTYEAGPQRKAERATRAHSTVTVDGHDSSEMWGAFRVARRARPVGLELRDEGSGGLVVRCAHDGYRRLRGRRLHRRTLRLTDTGLSVHDAVDGTPGGCEARFHLHPQVEVECMSVAEGHPIALRVGQRRLSWRSNGARASVAEGTFHPEFGVSLPTRCLVAELAGTEGQCEFDWS